MTERIKKVIAILIATVVTLVALIFYMFYLNNDQFDKIKRQDQLIRKMSKDDKEYLDTAKKISDSIRNIVSQFDYIIDGKKYTSDQFVKKYFDLSRERDKFKTLFELGKKEYGFNLYAIERKDGITYKFGEFSKADSAEITYILFKDRIRKTPKGWVYDGTSQKDIEDINNKLRNITKDAQKLNSDSSKKN